VIHFPTVYVQGEPERRAVPVRDTTLNGTERRGFYVACECGWCGPIRTRLGSAMADERAHLEAVREQEESAA
jgi:hypothetical protein